VERTLAAETPKKIGEEVVLKGWVNTIRDHGRVTFLDLRDASGVVQCVGQNFPKLTNESVVEVVGKVSSRPAKLINPKLRTGRVEVRVTAIKVLSLAKELPLPVAGDGYQISEEVRLKYRYLDLRRERLQRNLRLRSDYVQAARKYLFSRGFVEIETPYLSKSTPEGSRDFVVPSRKYPGKFYALPQSPQQYKQLLMIAGFEKYFQIARCFRDEDLRSDRGFEHTQIDLEMSFVEREDVMQTVEEMTVFACEAVGAKIAKKPFPILTFKEARAKYGSEKFDPRSSREKNAGVLSFAWVVDFPFFEKSREGKWTFTHNPFSAPRDEESERKLLAGEEIEEILTSQYDLICNGLEVAGGSIRTNKSEVLRGTYKILGYSEEELQESIGHLLEAFEYGVPPHGGCAQGFERLLMAYLGESFLREVQAFPMTKAGRTAVMEAPGELTPAQLKELGIKIVGGGKD